MADFYGTAIGYRQYCDDRARDIPLTVDDADIQAALLVASEFIDGRYLTLFPGLKVGGRNQIREWPRSGVSDRYGYAVPSDAIPREIENATYEAAAYQIAKPGSLRIDFTRSKYESVSIDGAISVKWNKDASSGDLQPQYVAIDQILAPLLAWGSADFSPLSGATTRV